MSAQCQCHRSEATAKCNCGEAIRRLSSKVSLLAECMSSYVRDESSERSLDSEMARMAAMLERIVGGRPVTPGAFPECCLVGQSAPNGTKSWFCTGVLIHKRIILTAAHCHQPPSPKVNFVALRADNMNSLGSANLVSVRRAVANLAFR